MQAATIARPKQNGHARMDHFSIWPSLVVFAACCLLLLPGRIWGFLDDSGGAHRYVAVDGLRGFLALAVVLHHCAISYTFQLTGRWESPPSAYYTLLGQGGVAVFFMITAFLFWGRILDQSGKVDWGALYVNRLFRIAPLYWAAVAVTLLIVAYKTNFTLAQPLGPLAMQVTKWLIPGLYNDPPPINGYTYTSLVLAGVTWTLYYEWIFYLSLPALAVAVVKRSVWGCLPAALWLLVIAPAAFLEPYVNVQARYYVALFGIGMAAAALVRKFPQATRDGPVRSVVAILLLAGFFMSGPTAYAWTPIVCIGAFFLLISSGTTLFGFLRARAARRLGTISYSIYLLQGLVIIMTLSPRGLLGFATRGHPQYWLVVLATALALVLVSVGTYWLIERPGISLGKRILKRDCYNPSRHLDQVSAAMNAKD